VENKNIPDRYNILLIIMSKGKRSWQPREMQMLNEWLAKNYPKALVMTRVRLGAPPVEPGRGDLGPGEIRMIGVWRRWADAIVITDNKILLIEAAIRPNPGKIAQLELYEMLIPQTPELAPWRDLPIEKILLYAIEDPATIWLARQKGIRAIYYAPPWLDSYLELLYPRERRGPRFTPPQTK